MESAVLGFAFGSFGLDDLKIIFGFLAWMI
jgi:hypothetical protein